MQGKYKLLIFLLFSVFLLFSNEEKNVSLFFKYESNLSIKNILIINSFIDSAESNISEKYQYINFIYNKEKIEDMNIRQIAGKTFSYGEDAFFLVDASADSNQIKIDIKLYSPILDIIYQDKYNIDIRDFDNSTNDDEINDFIDVFYKALDLLLMQKDSFKIKSATIKNELKFSHDFPIVNISLSAISLKIYFDARTYTKMFSFFPLDLRLTFFPLKYFESGIFIRLHGGDMVYKYYDIEKKTSDYFESPFDFSYGLFCGFSIFGDFYHYSTGIQIYNLFYSLYGTKYVKPGNIDGNFLPQISYYQKLDIRIFKFFNYSLFVNLKTMPLFILEDGYFYSKPFHYDFVNLEFSLIGFSLTF